MASKEDDLLENYETYQAQLRQVEAALMIDDTNEELNKLKTDLLEVINLTKELLEINETPSETSTAKTDGDTKPKWSPGDTCQAFKKSTKSYVDATIDMISDDGESCTVKFVNSNIVDVVKVSSLQHSPGTLYPSTSTPVATLAQPSSSSKQSSSTSLEVITEEAAEAPKKQKLTREEIERRKELKKKKLQKKKQKLKEFEEAREMSKQKWQNFYSKGSSK